MTSVIADAEAPGTVHFGLVELDLLAAHAGVSLPYPLRVPSFGRIAGEREVLLAAAGQTLRLRGFADETGPLGPAAELVAALREHRGTIDLALAGPGGATGVVAMVYRSWALICRQPLDDDPASTVSIRRVGQTALTDELLSMVPDLIPARSMPIVLPAHAVNTATRLIAEISDDAAKEQCLRDLVRDCGGDPEALGRLAGLLPELTGRGQFGATRRSGGGNVRAGVELSWLDGPRGRVRVNRATDGWVSVNPVRQADLRFELNDMATIVRSN